jgi:peptide subunit release factor 1 (eRF1)
MNSNLITKEHINELLEIKPAGTLVTSFYLNVDPRHTNPSAYKTVTNSLLRTKLRSLEKEDLSKKQLAAVKEDFEKIEFEVTNSFVPAGKVRGLVIIADGTRDLYLVYRVAQPVKSQVVVDPNPYIRPLVAILDEYHRLMLVLVDKQEARLLEVYMGEVLEHNAYRSDIEGKVRKGGWYGLEERRIERSIKNKVIRHYHTVANALLEHFRMGHFEYLFIGIKAEDYSLFFPLLHSYLQPRVKGRSNLSPKDHINTIIEAALEMERKINEEDDSMILERLIEALHKGGLAAKGIENVLRAIPMGACQALAVDDNYRVPGYICKECSYLDLKAGNCPFCGRETFSVEDVVEEAMEEVLLQRGEIKYITTNHPRLKDIEHIGAFLRYKIEG